jgi:PAS domain S-box-containing protein
MHELPNDPSHPAASKPRAETIAASVEAAAALSVAIVESCSEAIMAVAADGHIIGWNRAAARLSGYPADEVLARHWRFLVTAADEIPKLARAARRFEEDGENFRVEGNLRRKDGVHLKTLLSMSVIRDPAGKRLGLAGVFRDITADKLAIENLRQSEEKFKTVFKFSSDGISIASLIDGKYLEVNDECCRMLNLPADEIIGRTALELGVLTEAQQNEFGCDLLQTGAVRNREVTAIDHNGIIHRSLVSAVIVQIDGVQCALGFTKDISNLRRAEDDLLRLERQLSQVLANSPLAVLAVNNDHVITAARGSALAGTRIPVDQFVGKRLSEIFLPENPALRSFDRAFAGETFCATESVSEGKRTFEVWYSSVRDREQRVTGAIAVATDITLRKRAEDDLRRSEEYYRSLVESSADCTVVSNQEGIVTFVAGQGLKDLGYEISDLVGHRAMDFIHSSKQDDQKSRIAELFSHPLAISRGEAPIKCKDGSWLDCELIGRTALAPDGTPILVSLVRNISERKRAEFELASSRDQALAASRAKSEFLSSMSHEIRTPMNAILGMADLMWESELSSEQRRYLDTVINNGNALLELINSILDLAKVESGRLSLETVDFDLRDLLGKVTDTLAVRADENAVELAVHIDQDVPSALVGDPLRLRQVLTNLVGNAIKFTERGAIVIRVRHDPHANGAGGLLISVTDSGIGIPPDKLSGLFKPFSQADSSITRKYGGTGLGLAIVDRLVRLMGGEVRVESEPGHGSTFSFTAQFQVSATPAEAHRDAPAPAPARAIGGPDAIVHRPLRILLADDSADNRLLIRAYLRKTPYHLDEVEDGQKAIEQVFNGGYDLVLMDIQMPVMDGYTAVEKIREWEARTNRVHTPIIALTASALDEAVRHTREVGFDMHVSKPVKRATLLDAIAKTCANCPLPSGTER